METAYLGIDLAWSDANPTACCALDTGGVLVDERLVRGDDEILEWVADHVAGRAVLAVDAPLLVPNESGRRVAEAEVQRDFGSRQAGPHPTNRANLLRTCGRVRGEDLAQVLTARGFTGPWDEGPRTVLEVYPHPAIVEVFGLPERHRYKAKPGVSIGQRRAGLRRLDAMLGLLASADPPLRAASIEITDDMRGSALKDVEDLLDARLCAWVAAAWDAHGEDRIRLYGDRDTGHIAIPVGSFVDVVPRDEPRKA